MWLRWSWRDLRARWLQIGAIAGIIAIGSGVYSGLGSTAAWRTTSYDRSFAALHMYDLRVTLATGSTVDAVQLVDTIRSIPAAASLDRVSAQLQVKTQVDASTAAKAILVPGRIVGVDLDEPRAVNELDALHGRALTAADRGQPVGMLDVHFADFAGVEPGRTVRISGDRPLQIVSTGVSPEYFFIADTQSGVFGAAGYAVVFVPLATAQQLSGQPGAANSAGITLRPGADIATVREQVSAALAQRWPDIGFTVNDRSEDTSYTTLYNDIEGDQRLYNIFALLVLFGAAFAAFNLIGRMVEAQRREIGIGMALGVPRRQLALRPVLVAVQVALLGAVLGVAVGVVVGRLMMGLMKSFFPLPVWVFSFQFGTFLVGAALGLLIPFVATLLPVWRAVRVEPVNAIRTGVFSTKSSGLSRLVRRIPLSGRATTQMPFRNLLRAPRRTLMTVLGISASIVVLVGVVGMLDSFFATIHQAEAELATTNPDRYTVQLSSFELADSPNVEAIRSSPLVDRSELRITVGGTLRSTSGHGDKIDTLLELLPLDSPIWTPTIRGAVHTGGPGVVLADKTARDLNVSPGDEVLVKHPRREGLAAYRYVETPVTVVGTHPFPIRFVSFMDLEQGAALMNLDGVTNALTITPKPGVDSEQMKRAIFRQPGVASVQPVQQITRTIRDQIERFTGFLTVVEGAVLVLALLIAFNSASINSDERAREHATMFAFGMPVRSVLGMGIVESLVIGVLGTAVGIGVGYLLLVFIVQQLMPGTMPDIGFVTHLAPGTIGLACALGILSVAVAPLFTVRRLRRMDLPATLRVTE